MVSLDKYPCFCKDSSGLKSFEAKSDGVQYTRCANGKCGIFTRSENVPAYMEVFHDGVLPYYKKTGSQRVSTMSRRHSVSANLRQTRTGDFSVAAGRGRTAVTFFSGATPHHQRQTRPFGLPMMKSLPCRWQRTNRQQVTNK